MKPDKEVGDDYRGNTIMKDVDDVEVNSFISCV